MMPVYSVIVCPKCRKSAQLIEQKGAKTTRCQRCGTTLQTRKLRIFHTTETLEEAIAVRTKLQADILEKGCGTKPDNAPAEVTSFSTFSTFPGHEHGHAEKEITLNYQAPPQKPTPRMKKRDPAKTILSILEKSGGELKVTVIADHPLMQDFDEEIIEKNIKKLLQKGDIYSPKNGYIRTIP